MTEERLEVFREHLKECVEHFGRLFNSRFPHGKRGRIKALKPLADFCGVTPETTQKLLDGLGSLPVGEVLIKLLCYLDLHGYRIIEFERLPRVLRNFAELIGFSVLSAEEALKCLGYHQASEIYVLLRGNRGLTKDKEEKMWSAWKLKREELESNKKHAFNKSRLNFIFESPALQQIEQRVPVISEPTGSVASRRFATLCIMRGLLTLLHEGLFKDLSESEVEELDQADIFRIGELSVHFSTISSKLMRMKKE